jgi:hypothetical protein
MLEKLQAISDPLAHVVGAVDPPCARVIVRTLPETAVQIQISVVLSNPVEGPIITRNGQLEFVRRFPTVVTVTLVDAWANDPFRVVLTLLSCPGYIVAGKEAMIASLRQRECQI